MPPFRFGLQQVLDYRAQLEEQAKLVFARAKAEHDVEEQRAKALHEDLVRNVQKLYESAGKPRHEVWLQENYVKGLQADVVAAYAQLRLLARTMEDARAILVQRAQDRKLLEKLKAKQAERHAHEERLTEQRTYDETATLRFQPPSF